MVSAEPPADNELEDIAVDAWRQAEQIAGIEVCNGGIIPKCGIYSPNN